MWVLFVFLMHRGPPRTTRTDTLFPYTTLFRSMLARADPAHAHGAAFVAGGFDPVGNPRITMREHDRARTIGRDPGAVLVDVNVVVAIVQRLHPPVIDLQIPEPAFGNARNADHQRLVRRELPGDRKSTRLNSSP